MIYQESTAHQRGCLMAINPTTHTHDKVIQSIYDSTNTLAMPNNTDIISYTLWETPLIPMQSKHTIHR